MATLTFLQATTRHNEGEGVSERPVGGALAQDLVLLEDVGRQLQEVSREHRSGIDVSFRWVGLGRSGRAVLDAVQVDDPHVETVGQGLVDLQPKIEVGRDRPKAIAEEWFDALAGWLRTRFAALRE